MSSTNFSEVLSKYVGSYEFDGSTTYYRKNPNAGLTEEQIAANNAIKSTDSQEDHRVASLQYPDNYFDIDTTGCSDEEKTALGYVTDINKLKDPRYLNSLTSDEFQETVQKAIAANEKLTELYGDSPDKLDAITNKWETLRIDALDKDPACKEANNLSKETISDLAVASGNENDIMEDYAGKIDPDAAEESAVYAQQNGFSSFKDKAINLFKSAKEAIMSNKYVNKLIDAGKNVVNKVKGFVSDIAHRGNEFDIGGPEDGPDAGLEV